MALTTISARLWWRSPVTPDGPRWLIANRTLAYVGDQVLLGKPAGIPALITGLDRRTGAVVVRVVSGPRRGEDFSVWPTQIARVTRAGTRR